MCNLVAEIFKDGPEQDSLKRAVKVWFTRAQRPVKIIDVTDLDDDLSPEEIEPTLSERIERWSKELLQQGLAEGEAKGRVEGVHNVARNLLKKGMTVPDIAEVTGLTEREILSLSDVVSE